MTRSARRPRGTAAVETAILMVVLVPLVMYTLFLEDLLLYRLDQAEAVMSSTWDFVHQDYRHSSPSDNDWAQQFNMQNFWDHTSAWNTYSDANHDGQSEDHHSALAAHQCWLPPAREVACTVDTGAALTVAPQFSFKNKGGRATCSARLGVQNYFLPQKFMQFWAKEDMTQQKRWSDGNYHGNAGNDTYQFPEEAFSVMTDPWALNYIKAELASGAAKLSTGHDTGMHEPLLHPANLLSEWNLWVMIPWGPHALGPGSKVDKANDWVDDADDDFLTSMVKIDGVGDTLATPVLAWKTAHDRDESGWRDQRAKDTYNNMSSTPRDDW